MGESQLPVKEWLAKNHREMICCPHQPGNLMISKNACSKRYSMGQKEDYQDLMKGDVLFILIRFKLRRPLTSGAYGKSLKNCYFDKSRSPTTRFRWTTVELNRAADRETGYLILMRRASFYQGINKIWVLAWFFISRSLNHQ